MVWQEEKNTKPMPEACPVCRPRKPHLTPFYQCVQDHYETLEQVYPERFAKRYGSWRPYLKQIMVHNQFPPGLTWKLVMDHDLLQVGSDHGP